MDCSPPGSSVHGILQARILKWIAMPLVQGIFLPGPGIKPASLLFPAWQEGFLPLASPGKYLTVNLIHMVDKSHDIYKKLEV